MSWIVRGSVIPILVLAVTPSQAAKNEISPLANSHPAYLALRGAQVGQSFTVNDLTLTRDVGVFRLRSGTVTFLEPVLDQVPIAVFSGLGEFSLDAATALEADMIHLYTNQKSVKEPFKQAVFCFTDDTAAEIRNAGSPGSPGKADAILANFRKRMRTRRQRPSSTMEAILNGSRMQNIDANLLAGLLDPNRPRFFSAYIHGNRFEDLRFHVRPFGGVPQMLSPEEVALINFRPEGDMEGVWYLTHLNSEHASGIASSREDSRIVDVTHYGIDAEIASNRDLSATVSIDLEALHDGTRVVQFGLVPTLRVSNVLFNGRPTHFVQAGKREDPGFYVILPEALTAGRQYRIQVSYSGDEVIHGAGAGNLSVGSRSSWYPTVGSFRDRATYEMRFRFPKRYVLVGTGNRIDEGRDKKTAFASWKSEIPLKVAGFNIGESSSE